MKKRKWYIGKNIVSKNSKNKKYFVKKCLSMKIYFL